MPHDRAHFSSPVKLNKRYALLASFWAIVTVFILIVIKSYAYYASGSAAILGTLTDSVVDIAVSLMMLFAVRLSLKPADDDHRHGHGKIEGIAALMQGAFMGGAGLFLCFESFERFITPVDVVEHKLAIIVAVIAIILSFILVMVQKFVLRRAPSLAIEADHAHYKTDIALNGSVIAVLIIDYYGGPIWIDAASSLLIAAFFLWVAWNITNKSVDMLMDKELPLVRQNIENIIRKHSGVHDMHDLRTRMSGMSMHISFDIELDPELSLKAAHEIARELDHAIIAQYPNAEVIIHMDPIGDTQDARHSV